MAVSGLIVTLVEDAVIAQQAVATLSCDPRLVLGERSDRRVPLVAQTPSPGDDRELWDALRAMPGVENVDVAFVGFDEDGGPDLPQQTRRADR